MDVKETIETLAGTLGYNFTYGTRQFINYGSTLNDLKDGAINFMMLPESKRGIYEPGRIFIQSYEFTVQFQIARKWETGNATKSELDETYDQKYERRLKDMRTLGESFVKSFLCLNNGEPLSLTSSAEINSYAENFDQVNFELVFRVPN